MRLLFAVVANAVALFATQVVPGIHFRGGLTTLLLAGAVFGLFNLLVRPVAMLLSIPLFIVTLGLFYFVLNGILLYVAAWLMPGYTVSGLWPAILGSLVISVVNVCLGLLFPSRRRERS